MKHFRDKAHISVIVYNNNLDAALRRFKKKMDKENILEEYKERQVFKKKSEVRHHKKQKAKYMESLNKENSNG